MYELSQGWFGLFRYTLYVPSFFLPLFFGRLGEPIVFNTLEKEENGNAKEKCNARTCHRSGI